jgi:hypothetical protein
MKVYDLGTTTWLYITLTQAEMDDVEIVADNIASVNTVATNVADVVTFATTYLGAFSSATIPTTSQVGALYWNTTLDQLYVWDGSAWNEAAFSISGSVTSFNTRTGAVTLSSSDVTDALTAGSIATAKIADDAITVDKLANSINAEITANTAKVGITTIQADAIVANTAKVGITSEQASAITANTAKVTNATHTGDVTGDTALTIAAGAVDIAMLSATGTPSSGNFLRGDNTWTAVSTDPTMGGDLSGTASNAQIVASVVGVAELSATGTASATTYLRGDNSWATVSAGASAGGAIYENLNSITADFTFGTNKNGMSVGPITIAATRTVTVPSGQRWVIL